MSPRTGNRFQFAQEADLASVHDIEVLARAASDNRILVTHDRRTMPLHFADFITKTDCPGVFVISQHATISRVIDDLILIWHATEAEEYINSIRTLLL